jgi:hypothetical protein
MKETQLFPRKGPRPFPPGPPLRHLRSKVQLWEISCIFYAKYSGQMEHSCKNCDNVFTGKYCNACWQEWQGGRHSIGTRARARFSEFWHDVQMLLKTTLGLLIRPGTIVREYLAGKHKTWYNAVNYFLVAGSLTAAVTLLRAEAHPEELARVIEG